MEAGLHRFTVHGIDGNGTEGVSPIVLSGGYGDDVDLGDEIIYTGHGGNNPAWTAYFFTQTGDFKLLNFCFVVQK